MRTARPLSPPPALALLIALALPLAGVATAGEYEVGGWTPIFRGVELAYGARPPQLGPPQQVTAVRIDLSAPGVSFLSTPSNGDQPGETDGQYVSAFVREHHLAVGVNANFFGPCCNDIPGEPKDVVGLAVAHGDILSPPAQSGSGVEALLISRDNCVRFTSTKETVDLGDTWTAVAGSPALLRDGKNLHKPEGGKPEPRTAVGLTADERYLIFITIDGRQPGYSEGATHFETADWLQRFGAHDGINLDGGGSTSMVMGVGGGDTVILNRPINAGTPWRERVNGNNIGVCADPLP